MPLLLPTLCLDAFAGEPSHENFWGEYASGARLVLLFEALAGLVREVGDAALLEEVSDLRDAMREASRIECTWLGLCPS